MLSKYCFDGFPHSEICGSTAICASPQLIAACHVLLRLLMPRHSPCALFSLTFVGTSSACFDDIVSQHRLHCFAVPPLPKKSSDFLGALLGSFQEFKLRLFRRYCFTTSSAPLRCSSSSQKVFGLFGSPLKLASLAKIASCLLRSHFFSLPRSLILHKFWNYVSKFCPFKMLSVTLLLSEKTCFNIFAIPNSDILSTFLLFFSFPIQFPNNNFQP